MENNTARYDKVGRNIRGLRNAYGQSLLDLALDVGVGVSAISQYENGKRIPERDILVKIAKHFKITENELLFGDYSHMKDLTSASINDKAYNLAMIDRMLPLLFSEEAARNEDFTKAHALHKKLYEYIAQGIAWDDSEFDSCITLYKKAAQKGVIDATANIVWWIMFFGMIHTFMSPRLVASIESLHGKTATMKEIVNGMLYSPEDEEDEAYIEFKKAKEEFIEENEVDLLVNIALLKNSKKHMDLGDYYLALCYMFALHNNDMSPEMNSAIGYEMMYIFGVLGNPYAKSFGAPIEIKKTE